ncbi:hypothetical protein C8J57DRAFT_1593700 [Mycena rebaudengoi]|nr:hypothetical protein C8J57DRAFT_1593700 [Mycena rebaudengoi]
MDRENIDYMINHLFLPPKLPQEHDDPDSSKQRALAQHLSNCATIFYDRLRREDVESSVRAHWKNLKKMLSRFARIHEVAGMSPEHLAAAINKMNSKGEYVLCLHVSAQNAGIILRRTRIYMTLEFFMASPKAEFVTGTKGKLAIQFPHGPRLSLPFDERIVKSLAALLAVLEVTEMSDAVPKTKKARNEQGERREVTDIRYISELLGGIARSLTPDTETLASSTVYVTKRINDHVLWKKALLPWRRSPKWLVIRVALQTTLKQWGVNERYGYKVFIAFVLAKTLQLACTSDVSDDVLFGMNAKIAGRIWKLQKIFDPMALPFPLDFISGQVRAVEVLLHKRWISVQKLEDSPSTWVAPTAASIVAAKSFLLPRSASHFRDVRARRSALDREDTAFSATAFEENLVQSCTQRERVSPPSPIPSYVSEMELWFAILDVEQWVANGLAEWSSRTQPSEQLVKLKDMIERHEALAASLGVDNPEIFSRLFLTTIELWVSLDKAVTSMIPLLLDYSPGVTVESFEPLVLPELDQMQRLHSVEVHLADRHARMRYQHFSVFSFASHASAFPARYFQTDVKLQALRRRIQDNASQERSKKQRELETKNNTYTELMAEYNRHSCTNETYTEYTRWGIQVERTRHSSSCYRCAKKRQASELRIQLFEWPLPEDEIASRLVVFELALPLSFAIWRDVTYRLAWKHDSDAIVNNSPSPTPVLRQYPQLQPFYVSNHPQHQITIASTAKSFLVSHYNSSQLPATTKDVIKNHPLQYQMWDESAQSWLSSEFPTVQIRSRCTPDFPAGPFQQLSWTVIDTTHTPNMVIAAQFKCPPQVSYHEWEGFGHLRAGLRLQWRNMMLQLITATVNLAEPAVFLLFRQAAWQVERASESCRREAHFELAEEGFGAEILCVLNNRLRAITANWQEGWTAATLSVIACRLFFLSESKAVKEQVLDFLSHLRCILFGWMNQVLSLLNSDGMAGSESATNMDVMNRVLQLAASCRSTYAVDSQTLRHILNDPAAVSMFVQCAIAIQNNSPPRIQALPPALRYLVQRDVIFSIETVLPLIDAANSHGGEGLDDAVHSVWEGFRRDSSPWRVHADRWVTCITSPGNGRQIRHVCVDLVDGSLLVDGKAQGTLPKEMLRHPIFRSVFPSQASVAFHTLEITPSTMKGMTYQSRKNIDGFEVHFKLSTSGLLIRIRDESDNVSEFIPSTQLAGDIPNILRVDLLHIFHEKTQSMDIYPALLGWNPSVLATWRMLFTQQHPTLSKVTSDDTVQDILSPTSDVVKALSAVFQPLERLEEHLLVSWKHRNGAKPVLHVGIPRYNLEFSVGAEGHLESKELPGFDVASSQYIKTLIGLKSKLILQSQNGGMSKMIIPKGEILISRSEHHPDVSVIPPPGEKHVHAFIYDVDSILYRLIGDGTLSSWYFLAHLHLVTSSHLRDPLTDRTGVQQAIEMLRSPHSFAFMNLQVEHIEALKRIVDLTPDRQYYPTHLTTMETIEWDARLSPLVQSGPIVPLVAAIVEYAHKQALFYPLADKPDHDAVQYQGSSVLRERADFRNSRIFNVLHLHEADRILTPGDCLHCPVSESTAREQNVADTAYLTLQWPRCLNITDDLWSQFQKWYSFSSHPTVESVDAPRLWLFGSTSEVWFNLLSLYKAWPGLKDRDQYGLLFAFGILAHRGVDLKLVRTLLSVATNVAGSNAVRHAVKSVPLDNFNLESGHELDLEAVRGVVRRHCSSFGDRGEVQEPRKYGESEDEWTRMLQRQAAFEERKTQQCQTLAEHIFRYWPSPGAVLQLRPMDEIIHAWLDYPVVKMDTLRPDMSELLSERLRNRGLFEWAMSLQNALKSERIPYHTSWIASPAVTPDPTQPLPRYQPITLSALLRSTEAPDMSPTTMIRVRPTEQSNLATAAFPQSLGRPSLSAQLVEQLGHLNLAGPVSHYIADLSRCVAAFAKQQYETDQACRQHQNHSDIHTRIAAKLLPATVFDVFLRRAGQWPSVKPESLVRQLSRESRKVLGPSWISALSWYARGLSEIQQKRRILSLSRPGLEAELARETRVQGGEGWDPAIYTDWLLVQLDADLLIRPVQASIAQHMMMPESSENTLMQLNMGEGKSSVIAPIIAATLADGTQLVRVIVLKPLSTQMFQLIKQRVCGLANRRLFYLPFSRDIPLDSAKIQQIEALLKECAAVGGILLCQPEHILSFQLMGLHTFCENGEFSGDAQKLMKTQEWLDSTARDILDESDEILSVRYQLIYTVGTASALEGQPGRWDVTQEVFSLLEANLDKLATSHPLGIELKRMSSQPRQFPVTRILSVACCKDLLDSLAHQIVYNEKLPSVSFRTYSSDHRSLAFRFIRQLNGISADESAALQQISGDVFGQLLLLRGLIAHGIIKLSLQEKRWRVDYGLDPTRSMLAVPYRAKDTPAPRAEFGHPDMIIVLTCLSYYYGGLTDDQLSTTFKHLFDSDNPAIRYEDWIKGYSNLPENLTNLRGLNLDDFEQRTVHIFPRLRYNKSVIDFFLSECVFPKEAREFQHKLTTNAWDLARKTARLKTGFSGTNDNKYLLPLSIEQLDQESQRHTNAQVIEHILQPENSEVLCTDSDDALGLLNRVVKQKPPVMVLLDVGAQVLELQNEEVARQWLKLDARPGIEAAVYFNPSDDEIHVLLRDGRKEPLASSLYRTQLDKTLVYLDEAHTRGTDFKFPSGARAVVTLGPKLTKDKLVQGCMRMRRLGSAHSVLFFASGEICGKITQLCAPASSLNSSHVLQWTIQQTCLQIQDNGPLWASQGVNFDHRRTAYEQHRANSLSDQGLAAVLKERESHTLEELYGVEGVLENRIDGSTNLQRRIQGCCRELGIVSSLNSTLLEEQERELAHEKEDEREVERIAGAKPLDHHIDRNIEVFIRTGADSHTFISLAACLANTSQISLLPQGHVFRGTKLRTTKDFRDTIVLSSISSAGSMDSYLRSVQWILSSSKSELLLLISPFEANALLPQIRSSATAHLHLYAPRVSRNTQSFEDLQSFVVPRPRSTLPDRSIIHELNLFAGQLFFADRRAMKEVCALLGLHLQAVPEALQGRVELTGFVSDSAARTMLGLDACSFSSNPLPFIRELFGWCRKGQGFALTHAGQIVRGNDLQDTDFDSS